MGTRTFHDLDFWPFKALDKTRRMVLLSPCTTDDLDDLVAMYETFEPKGAVNGLPPVDPGIRSQWVKQNLAVGHNLKVEVDGKLTAQGYLLPFSEESKVEFGLFVHNAYQHRGIGYILASVLVVAAKKIGIETIWINEQRRNARAVNLYLKLGFVKSRHGVSEVEFTLDMHKVPEDTDLDERFAKGLAEPTGMVEVPDYLQDQELFEETRSVFLFSPKFQNLKLPEENPFKTNRSRLALDLINRYGLLNLEGVQMMWPHPLDEASVMAFHDPRYYYYLQMGDQGGFVREMLEHGLGTPENPVAAGLIDYIRLTAGASVAGADLLINHEHVDLVFSPTGGFHHAGPDYAAGFCYVNDVVIAIQYLLQKRMKVLYIDLDAHHGDGVQFAFYDDPRVFAISLHESGRTLFPWTSGFENELGEFDGYGYNVNVPFAPGTDDWIYRQAFNQVVDPLARSFDADICICIAGVDGIYTDPLTHLSLTNNVLSELILEVRKYAPKLLILGGGGYNAQNIARTWTLIWSLLHDAEPGANYFGEIGALSATASEVGTLRDTSPFIPPARRAEAAATAETVVGYLRDKVLPLHGVRT